MPIPRPRSGEKQDEFVSRCMSEMAGEFPDEKQRAAVCYRAYREEVKQEIVNKCADIIRKL